VRDREALADRCTRFVSSWEEEWRRPRSALGLLSERVDASVGADRYGSGELVERLERRVAGLLGKDAALFLPSGTMAQQIALRIWADRSGTATVAFHPQCHLEAHEERAYAHLHGLRARLVGDPDRLIRIDDLEAVDEPVAALLLELPQRDLGGQLPPWDELVAQTAWARERGVALHLDGARLWQCPPAYGRPLDEIAALFDTVYVSFYKDLGAPAGSALAGPADVIEEARVWQVRHGGRLFSIFPLLVAAERGLDDVLPRMPAFVERARELGRALAAVGLSVVPDPPQAAMLHVELPGSAEALLEAALDVAEDRRAWVLSGVRETDRADVQRAELTVGASTLAFESAEVAALYAGVVERAAGGRCVLRGHVERHNAGVRSGDFAPMLAWFAEDAQFVFEAIPVGPFLGRDAIAAAFRERPPDDEVDLLDEREEGGEAVAGYAWRAEPGVRAGELRLTHDGHRIRRLVIGS
jgi:threonine aldolase